MTQSHAEGAAPGLPAGSQHPIYRHPARGWVPRARHAIQTAAPLWRRPPARGPPGRRPGDCILPSKSCDGSSDCSGAPQRRERRWRRRPPGANNAGGSLPLFRILVASYFGDYAPNRATSSLRVSLDALLSTRISEHPNIVEKATHYASAMEASLSSICEREREKYYTYPAPSLIQVLPGHPLADPKR